MASTTPRIDKMEKAIFGGTIETAQIAVPYTQIINTNGQARKIPDLANNMKVSGGIERIMFNSITALEREFGPNGEKVYELDNRDARIRFVGEGWQTIVNTNGTYVTNTDQELTDYIEITFWGTGLNFLNLHNASTGDYRSTVDNGTESANLYAVENATTQTRDYNVNTVHPIASGLAEGLHTIKLRQGAAVTNDIIAFGVEILNEQSQFTINPGKPLMGNDAREILFKKNLPFKPAGVSGARGARVLIVQDGDGVVSQKYTETDAAQLDLGAADHSNEEIIRRINFLEFGANRSDDFSTLTSSSDRAFTLNDGTTTLVGNDVRNDGTVEGLFGSTTGDYFILTFVGTGLDVTGTDSLASTRFTEIEVDGILIGNVLDSDFLVADVQNRVKIVSGLPYGTHTVKFEAITGDTGASTSRFNDFLIYGPKKPAIDAEDNVLADYNLMADFVANATSGRDTMSTGVLRKIGLREFAYTGTNVSMPIDPVLFIGGFNRGSTTAAAKVEYTFWGTGFDFRWYGTTGQTTGAIIDIDGSTDHSSLTTSVYGAGSGFVDSTGTLDQATTSQLLGCGVVINGLPLGKHTVTITANGSGITRWDAIDIITPIHINDFRAGSNSIRDEREDAQVQEEQAKQVDLGEAKAWLKYDHINNIVLASHNISAVIDVSTGHADVHFIKPFKDNNYIVGGTAIGISLFLAGNHAIAQGATASSYRVIVQQSSATTYTDAVFTVAFYGELENEEE